MKKQLNKWQLQEVTAVAGSCMFVDINGRNFNVKSRNTRFGTSFVDEIVV